MDIGDDVPVEPDNHGDYPVTERRELLLHRCFVRSPSPPLEDVRFPFKDRLRLRAAEWPLRPDSIVHG